MAPVAILPARPCRRPGSAATLIAVVAVALLLGSCGVGNDPVTESLAVDLARATDATCTGMGLTGADRPSERGITLQVQLLANRCDPARVQAIRTGAMGSLELKSYASRLLQMMQSSPYPMKPPRMFGYLIGHFETLDLDQRLLLYALGCQMQIEGHLRPGPGELPL